LTPAPRRQDHTSLPYASAARVSRSLRVHRNPPLVVTTADAHSGWDGMAVGIALFGLLIKRNIFYFGA
jgi:hypothetical protein